MKQGQLPTRPRCPHCAGPVEGYTAVGHNKAPYPGAVTVCAYCATILEYDMLVTPQRPPPERLAKYRRDPLIMAMVRRLRAARLRPPAGRP